MQHHYLNAADLSFSSRCYVALAAARPVAFAAMVPERRKCGPFRRVSRLVVLPDFQGVGIGMTFLRTVATLEWEKVPCVRITTSHPAMIAALARAADWRIVRHGMCSPPSKTWQSWRRTSWKRLTGTFEFRPIP